VILDREQTFYWQREDRLLRPGNSGFCGSGCAVFIDIFDGTPHYVHLNDLEFIGPEFEPKKPKKSTYKSEFIATAVIVVTILGSITLLLSIFWIFFNDLLL
jgi:hypothetical protein